MTKEKAEELRLKVIERRDYFKRLEHPLIYSKTQLHSGMRGRTVRQEDRIYMQDVKKKKAMSENNLKTIDKYLSDLDRYKNSPQQPVGGSGASVYGVTTFGDMSMPKAPTMPSVELTPKIQMRRKVRRGIGGY